MQGVSTLGVPWCPAHAGSHRRNRLQPPWRNQCAAVADFPTGDHPTGDQFPPKRISAGSSSYWRNFDGATCHSQLDNAHQWIPGLRGKPDLYTLVCLLKFYLGTGRCW